MGTKSNKKRKSESAYAKKRLYQSMIRSWTETLSEFDDYDLGNTKGRTRTCEENKIVLLSIQLCLRINMRMVANGLLHIRDISWRMIEEDVSVNIRITKEHVSMLRKQFFEDGEVLTFGETKGELSKRGAASPNYVNERKKLSKEDIQIIIDEVDFRHGDGKTVTNQIMRNFVRCQFKKIIGRTTMSLTFKQLGLTWKPIRSKKKNLGSYRMDALRTFLIKLDSYYKEYIKQAESWDHMFVFTDETYIHRTHAQKKSYLGGKTEVNRGSSKGERLIILHAITPTGPLCERINNKPVECLTWTKDTPHPDTREDRRKTCELIWKASSKCGDYHDNMNSEMFMQWVIGNLVPTFDLLHPNKKMILVCDNAAYHHCREMGSLASKTKSELIEICKKYEINFLDLPLTEKRYEVLWEEGMYEGVTDLENDFCRVVFNEFEMNARATATIPFIPNIEELKQAIVRYCQEFIPSLLECKVEAYLHQRGHKILWTPPYCPDLQPIELYWAAGKNHAAMKNHSGIKMKEVVRHLREGWYGNISNDGIFVERDDEDVSLESQDDLPIIPYDHIEKKEVDCHALFRHAIDQANKKFIPMCVGISGTIGELVVDNDHIANKENLPIDMFVLDITNGMEFEGEDVTDDVIEAVEVDDVNENSHANLIAESFSL